MVRHSIPSPMLSVHDVADMLSVHINTVRRWSNSGILKAYRVGPRGDRRFKKEDVDSFLAENGEADQKVEARELSLTQL